LKTTQTCTDIKNSHYCCEFIDNIHDEFPDIKLLFDNFIITWHNNNIYLYVKKHRIIEYTLFKMLLSFNAIEKRIEKIEEHLFKACDFCRQYNETVEQRRCRGGKSYGEYCRDCIMACAECDKIHNTSRDCGHKTFLS
jgi:hypothetical protein